MAKLPKAVEEQDRLATEMMEKANEEVAPQETPVDETPRAETPPAETPPAETLPVQPPVPEETWESRYKVLQGKYDREVPMLYNQLADFKIMIADLNARLSTQERTVSERPAISKEAPPEVQYVKSEIPELDVAMNYQLRQFFDQEIKPYIDQRTGDLTGKITSIETTTARTAADRYEDALTEKVPNWKAINRDPGFEVWLSERDRYTGVSRLDLLKDAHQSLDAKRVSVFFTDYIESKGTPSAKGGKNIDKFTAPPKSGSSTPPSREGIRSFTSAEIKTFYDNVSKGFYRGKEAEMAAMEKQIDQAVAAGMIN